MANQTTMASWSKIPGELDDPLGFRTRPVERQPLQCLSGYSACIRNIPMKSYELAYSVPQKDPKGFPGW
jgi:hypothetical protein